VALVEHDHGRASGRGILPELVADLGYDRRAGSPRALGHGLEPTPIVQADFARYSVTVDQKVLSLVQRIKTPVLKKRQSAALRFCPGGSRAWGRQEDRERVAGVDKTLVKKVPRAQPKNRREENAGVVNLQIATG
jgi:hypothetical protein